VQLSPDAGFEKYMYLGQLLEGEAALEATQRGVELLQQVKQGTCMLGSPCVRTACLLFADSCLAVVQGRDSMQPAVAATQPRQQRVTHPAFCLLHVALQQTANELQESAGADSIEHRHMCKQLAQALCSLAEMKVALAEDVAAVSLTGFHGGCFLPLSRGGGGSSRKCQVCAAGRQSLLACSPSRQCDWKPRLSPSSTPQAACLQLLSAHCSQGRLLSMPCMPVHVPAAGVIERGGIVAAGTQR
jgi:hypothetical protein